MHTTLCTISAMHPRKTKTWSISIPFGNPRNRMEEFVIVYRRSSSRAFIYAYNVTIKSFVYRPSFLPSLVAVPKPSHLRLLIHCVCLVHFLHTCVCNFYHYHTLWFGCFASAVSWLLFFLLMLVAASSYSLVSSFAFSSVLQLHCVLFHGFCVYVMCPGDFSVALCMFVAYMLSRFFCLIFHSLIWFIFWRMISLFTLMYIMYSGLSHQWFL